MSIAIALSILVESLGLDIHVVGIHVVALASVVPILSGLF